MVLAWKKRNLLIFAAAAALLLSLVPISAYAQTESTVNATVEVGFVAVSVTPGSVAYGALILGATGAVPSPTTVTATNDGTVPADFAIRGADTAVWALSPTAGSEQYVHRASPDAFTTTIVLTTSNATLDTAVAASGTTTVSLNMDMPTASAASVEQTAAVIVVATIAP